MIKHSAEWNEILGDMVDDVREEREVLEAMADESEMGDADYDDWYQHISEELAREEREIWADFWNDKERG
mgnify:FL=1